MADISKEIQDFRDAVYGEEVRGSMISLAEKVNRESTDARKSAAQSLKSATDAVGAAEAAIESADTAAGNANTAAKNIQDQADRGDFTGTIQIGKVTTGEAGSQASVENTGTSKDAVLDITIPAGDKGVSMRMAGDWTIGTEYVNDVSNIDFVSYNGSTYGCRRSHTASEEIRPTDPDYWQVVAQKGDTGNIDNIGAVPIVFEEAAERENIESGDSIPTGFGKIRKWFSSLGQAAFRSVVNGVTQSEAGQAVLDAAVGKYLDEKKLDITRVVANRNITENGFAMDGKTAADWFNELNGNIKTSAKSLVDFIRIPLGEDMKSETYKIPGNYVCVADATATTLINCPLKTSFFLTVQDNDGDILQTFTEWRGQSVVMRTYYTHSSKWLDEYTYITKSDLESFGFPNARIVEDLHTIQQSCFFRYNAGTANSPSSDRGGIGLYIYANDSWRFLLVIPYNTVDMYVSTIDYTGMWTTWTKK